MIDQREIHQGCHLLYGDDMVEVEDIGHLKDIPTVVVKLYGQRTLTMPKTLDPIPLTESLLMDIGFEKLDDKFDDEIIASYIYKDGDGHIQVIHYRDNLWQVVTEGSMFVSFLHELEGFIYLSTKRVLL